MTSFRRSVFSLIFLWLFVFQQAFTPAALVFASESVSEEQTSEEKEEKQEEKDDSEDDQKKEDEEEKGEDSDDDKESEKNDDEKEVKSEENSDSEEQEKQVTTTEEESSNKSDLTVSDQQPSTTPQPSVTPQPTTTPSPKPTVQPTLQPTSTPQPSPSPIADELKLLQTKDQKDASSSADTDSTLKDTAQIASDSAEVESATVSAESQNEQNEHRVNRSLQTLQTPRTTLLDETASSSAENQVATQSASESSDAASSVNEATVETTATVSAVTGENQQTNDEEDSENIAVTGEAIAQLSITEILNTLLVNSSLALLNYDITDTSQEALDLTLLFSQLQQLLASCDDADNPCSFLSEEQSADLTTDVTVTANSGQNSQTGSENTALTGDASALANLVQVANSQLYDSEIVIVMINILVPWSGDIYLPQEQQQLAGYYPLGSEATPSAGVSLEQIASVATTASVSATTGENIQYGESENVMATGDAYSAAYIDQYVNSFFLNQLFWQLILQNPDLWSGNSYEGVNPESSTLDASVLVGSENDIIGDDQRSTANSDSQKQSTNNLASNNLADIFTNLQVSANTGGNYQEGETNYLQTGSATAIANIVQMINTTWVNSRYFLGVINIINPWSGNLWFGQPPEQTDSGVGGTGDQNQDELTEEKDEEDDNDNDDFRQLPEVALSVQSTTESVEAGQDVNFLIKLDNFSDEDVHKPLLEQTLVNNEGVVLGIITYQLPSLANHSQAHFNFTLRTPARGSLGIHTSQLVLIEEEEQAIVSNRVASQFTIRRQYLAQQAIIPTEINEVTIEEPSVLGVQAAESDGQYVPNSDLPWSRPSVLMLPLLFALYMILRRTRRLVIPDTY